MATNPATLETHRPPYDVTADFLFVLALSATAPLRQSFPEVPFLSVFGKTPLVLWFSLTSEACYYDVNHRQQCEQGTDQIPYRELNVVTLLNKKVLFVPRIYASSHLSVVISSLYGMPKTRHDLSWSESEVYISSELIKAEHRSFVRARPFLYGKIGAKLLSFFLPFTTWPVLFPGQTRIRAIIKKVPAIRPALIKKGQLSLPEPWLPDPVSFFPIGLYVPQLVMHLPPP